MGLLHSDYCGTTSPFFALHWSWCCAINKSVLRMSLWTIYRRNVLKFGLSPPANTPYIVHTHDRTTSIGASCISLAKQMEGRQISEYRWGCRNNKQCWMYFWNLAFFLSYTLHYLLSCCFSDAIIINHNEVRRKWSVLRLNASDVPFSLQLCYLLELPNFVVSKSFTQPIFVGYTRQRLTSTRPDMQSLWSDNTCFIPQWICIKTLRPAQRQDRAIVSEEMATTAECQKEVDSCSQCCQCLGNPQNRRYTKRKPPQGV